MAKKHTQSTAHEYISINQYQHGYLFRLSNYFVLLSMVGIQKQFSFDFPDGAYLLVVCAILGYDVEGIFSLVKNLVGKKK